MFISGHSKLFKGKDKEGRMPFLQKPFRASDLAVRVREILGKEKID